MLQVFQFVIGRRLWQKVTGAFSTQQRFTLNNYHTCMAMHHTYKRWTVKAAANLHYLPIAMKDGTTIGDFCGWMCPYIISQSVVAG